MSAPILVVGSVALDSVDTPFESRDDLLGGAAVHFSAAAGLFTQVRLVGVVGSDYPMDRLEMLKRRNVDMAGVAQADGPSFRWRGRYELDMDHRETLMLDLGVFQDFRPSLPEGWADTPVAFMANIDPDLQLQVLGQASGARLRACDTIEHWIAEKRSAVDQLFSSVDLVFLNEDEARYYADTPNLRKAGQAILERGCKAVLIKKGGAGALVMRSDGDGPELFVAAAYPLEDVVDPTGAGDAFAGGVMGWLARAEDYDLATLRQAVVAGSVVASFAVEGFGPERVASITMAEVIDRFRHLHEMVVFEEAH